MKNIKNLLKELTQTVGVSGSESNIVNLLKSELQPYGDVTVDPLNNVKCVFGEGKHFLLDAHMDEIGLIVTDIDDKGFIKVSNCGGIDCSSLPDMEVSVWGKREIKGIVSTLPPHLQSADDEKKTIKISDLAIDTGYTKKQLDMLVSPGDRVTFKRNYTELLNGFVSASCLDNRCGVAAILLCLDELKKLPCKVTVLFSSQEEVGTRGAKSGAYDAGADEAIVVDVSFALSPGCEKRDCGEISKGAMIGFSPILDREMSLALVKTANENNIKYQREIMSGRTGTNADVISTCQNGIKTALISIPLKYMHRRTETINPSDAESVKDLICAYIKERTVGGNA